MKLEPYLCGGLFLALLCDSRAIGVGNGMYQYYLVRTNRAKYRQDWLDE